MKWAALLKWGFGTGLLWMCAGARAQPLMVYSEFAKIDVQGNVTVPENPREILSPAIARNAFSTFQVVIQVPQGTPYTVRMGLNPENAVKVTLYRETDEKTPGGPKLERIQEPWDGDSSQTLWMDLWVERDAPVRRIKVEPQLFVDGDWVIYPMEMRVRETQVPDSAATSLGILEPFTMMQAALCKRPLRYSSLAFGITPTGLRHRNAMQDVALAEAASATDREELKKRLGGCDAKQPPNPEAYLRIRDYFFTPLWMKVKGN